MAVGGANGDMIDLESSLLQQFSCLGTQDKDVLINEFQRLLSPNQLSPEGCAFFLDMNNWNLQQAICSYFDLDAPKELGLEALPAMSFIKDVTIGEGEEVPPNTRFVKTWRLQNSGTEKWPPGCSLRFINGHLMGNCERLIVDPLEPGQMVDVSLEMVSPGQPGIYQGQWKMSNAFGQFFGEIIWVIITVAEGGLLGLTQQMDSFHQLGSPVKNNTSQIVTNTNPFASHTNRLKPGNILESVNISPYDMPTNANPFVSQANRLEPGEGDDLQFTRVNFLRHADSIDTDKFAREWEGLTSNNSDISDQQQQQQHHQPQPQTNTHILKNTDSPKSHHDVDNRRQSGFTQQEAMVLSLSGSNHLPPTPPPSEDMML